MTTPTNPFLQLPRSLTALALPATALALLVGGCDHDEPDGPVDALADADANADESSDPIEPIGDELAPPPAPPETNVDLCGETATWQDVESYDGTLGPSADFVEVHERPVALIRWRDDLATRYDDPDGVAGQPICTGTLVSRDLLLTSGICMYPPYGQRPQHFGGGLLTQEETAAEMVVEFRHQRRPNGTLRSPVTYDMIEVLENGFLESPVQYDFAVVRLEHNPGLRWGSTPIRATAPALNSELTVIQHPNGDPKVVEAGLLDNIDVGNMWSDWSDHMEYDDIDTAPVSYGAGVLDSSGAIVGVQQGFATCAGGGHNQAAAIYDILNMSDTLDDLVWGDVPLVGDLDGDGEDEMIIHRQSNHRWYALRSDGSRVFPAGTEPSWGASGMIPMIGNLDGDAADEMILWNPSTGKWYALRRDGSRIFPAGTEPAWGTPYAKPLIGDLDGDGADEMIVWEPLDTKWYALRRDGSPIFPVGTEPAWGTRDDIPLLGDLDDDGEDEMIMWRTSNTRWYALRRDGSRVFPVGTEPSWGTRGDIPFVANLDSALGDDMVLWRPSNGKWYGLRTDSSRLYAAGQEPSHGIDGDVPLVGNFDGVGKGSDDMAVWRPSSAQWSAWSAWGASIFSNVVWGLPY